MFPVAFLNISKHFEAQKILFAHQVEAMRLHETTEASLLCIKVMTEPDSDITMANLKGTYESQGRLKKRKNKTVKNQT